MNLLVKKTGLILGLALFLFACEEPGEIGLELSPDTGAFISSSIEIPIKASVGIAEPYITSDSTLNHRYIAVGRKQDVDYGTIEITGFCDLILPNDTIEIPENAVYTNAEISIITKNFFGIGPVYQNQNIKIHELDEPVTIENTRGKNYSYLDEALAELELEIDTSYLINTKIFKGTVSDNFGQKIVDAAKENAIFNQNIGDIVNGLAIVPDAGNNLLFHIDPNFYESNITIRYSVNSTPDSIVLFFRNRPTYYTNSDYTGTELEGLQPNIASNTSQYIYLNSINGTFMELDLSEVRNLADSLGPMVINSAELFFEDANADTLYRVSNSIVLNAFEKSPDFNYAEQSFFKFTDNNNEFFTGINLNYYRFTMGLARKSENRSEGLLFVNSTVKNEYTPSSGRGPAFVDFIQSIVATNSKVVEPKYLLFLDSYGKSFQQIRFNKDNIRLKLYFSYLRDEI